MSAPNNIKTSIATKLGLSGDKFYNYEPLESKKVPRKSSDIFASPSNISEFPPPDLNDKDSYNKFLPIGSIRASVFNLVSATLGAGCLALPYCITLVGLFWGVILLSIGALLTIFSIHLLIWSTNKTNKDSYEDLATYLFGKKTAIFVEIAIILFCFGTCVGYFVAVADIFVPVSRLLFGSNFLSSRYFISIFFGSLIMYPLSCFDKINSLRFTSFLGVFTTIFLIIVIIGIAVYSAILHDFILYTPIKLFNFDSSIFQALPVIMFSFTCQVNVFYIFNELERKSLRRMNFVSHYSMSLAFMLYMLIGCFGYVFTSSEGIEMTKDVLDVLSITNPITVLAQAGVAITIVLAYPLNVFPMRFSIEKLFFSNYEPSTARKFILTFIMVFSSLALALVDDDINSVFALVGSVCSSTLCFIFPSLFYLAILYKEVPINKRSHYFILTVFAYIMLFVGVFGGGISTYTSVYNLF